MNTQTIDREHTRVSPARLWFGVCAAPAAWLLEHITWFIVSSSTPPGRAGAGADVRLVLGIATLVLLAVAVAGGVVSFQNWRRLSDHTDFTHGEGRSRPEFLALTGILISVSFVVGILWIGLPLFLIASGVRAR